MTREEAIEWMEETIQDAEKLLDKCSPELKEEILEQNEVFKIAISALRSTPQPGKPLTLDQLREMDGQPVWIEDTSCWGLVFIPKAGQFKNSPFVLFRKEDVQFEWHVTDSELTIYSYPPAHIDRSEWEPCEHCKPSEYPPDYYGPHNFPIVENEIYFYDTDDGWQGEEIKYCPWCGRPLTEEAWVELERRVKG